MSNSKLTNGQCGICANCAPQINGGSGFNNCEEAHAAKLAEDGMESKRKAAVATLEHHGFTWHGGEQWKPPLGLPPAFASNDRAELQEYRKAAPVEINDEMAFAFCRAISDDAVGADEAEDIKTGLRAAFANITTPQPAPAVEAAQKFSIGSKFTPRVIGQDVDCDNCVHYQPDVCHGEGCPAVEAVPDGISGPLAYAYKELTPQFMRNHIRCFERYGIVPKDDSTVIQALRIALDGMERRAAMLQGADGTLTDEDTKRVGELVMWVKRLARSLRKAKPDSKLQSDAMDYLSRKGLIGVEDVLR